MRIALKHHLWNGDQELTLDLPERWNTKLLFMEGDRCSPLREYDYRHSLAGLAPMIKGKKEICILFDDLSRPTKAHEIVPFLLELFEQKGIRDEQIRFICALGTHAPLDNADFRKKLGVEVLERFPVYNHNPYENCRYLGQTTRGTPVMVNREYLACDLRIGIGAFIPHSFCGFGGGYKIIMPAISHIDAIEYHHGALFKKYRDTVDLIGKHHDNPLFDDLREYGRLAGLNAKIDVLVNTRALATDLFAGDPDELYAYMLARAPRHYAAKIPFKADIVFANVYAKANEAAIGLCLAKQLLKDQSGRVVLLCDQEGGQILHYLLGRFGNDLWGRLAFSERQHDGGDNRIFIYSRFKDRANEFWFGKPGEVVWYHDMENMVKDLDATYTKDQVDVLVIPDATIQTLEGTGS